MSLKKYYEWSIRISFLIIYFWFGILKVLDKSPATDLVEDLLHIMLPFFEFKTFFILLGFWEIWIGLIFLFPYYTKLAIFITSIHLLTTFLPMVLLPSHTWSQPWVMTIESQYIIKNLFIISSLLGLYIANKEKFDFPNS